MGATKQEACAYVGITTRSLDRCKSENEDFRIRLERLEAASLMKEKNVRRVLEGTGSTLSKKDMGKAKLYLERIRNNKLNS